MHGSSRVSLIVVLTILFCVGLAIPLSLIFFGAEYLVEQPGNNKASNVDTTEIDSTEPDLFPVSGLVKTAGDFIALPHHQELVPSADKDFIFFCWVWFKRHPKEGESIVFLAKFDSDHRMKRGYSFGITRKHDRLRPIVYWRDEGGKGSSLVFTDFPLVPKQWMLVSFGFFEGKYLAARTFYPSTENDQLSSVYHGGHFLGEESVVATSTSDLILGARRNGNFRGRFGPYGIFQGAELQERYEELMKELSAEPQEMPEGVEKDEVKLFVSDVITDLSPWQHKVRVRGMPHLGEIGKKHKEKRHGKE